MAISYAFLRQNDQAIKAYLEAIKANPYYTLPYYNVAQVYYAEKQMDNAIKYMERAVQLDPGNSKIYYSLGGAYLENGNKEKACYNFNRADALGEIKARVKLISECNQKNDIKGKFLRKNRK